MDLSICEWCLYRKEYADKLREDFINNRKILITELTNRNITFHPRIPEALSWLFIGFEKFLNLMNNANVLTMMIYNF